MEAVTLRELQETDMIKPKDGKSAIGNRKPKTETRNPVLDGIQAKIMMEALTLRGLQETDTIKPEDGKSENGKS